MKYISDSTSALCPPFSKHTVTVLNMLMSCLIRDHLCLCFCIALLAPCISWWPNLTYITVIERRLLTLGIETATDLTPLISPNFSERNSKVPGQKVGAVAILIDPG